ncbi:hypothetical protein DO97_05890 [Neosynechococcus sphagnicola sy1]|uniref:DUF1817 domain-containing protein n=2 Tax=Neosynechococcus TaxID=1501143 RepID=A0A098TSY3_9CYAN|nr:CRR6 family NdhI maturation factor [Neosynechococcus sphagnicola]KGF73888.1 hypothetical protein DO97_05890 [Neosynechococcus sphagnicola sy1]
MPLTITVDTEAIQRLDLSPAEGILKPLSTLEAPDSQLLQLQIDYVRDADDPRELSEIPEVRLWFIRLDSRYPWLPLYLDWQAGELGRYTAMLVPHQFSAREGIQFNPEALEIFLMQKIFVLTDWLKQQGSPRRARLKAMAQILGYELDDGFFEVIDPGC